MAKSEKEIISSGFPPIAASDARILILGSLPGVASLSAVEYYAHRRNAFWPIMREVFGTEGSYAERCRSLCENRVAVWDVLDSSVRPGSLDAAIRLDSATPNDFNKFFSNHKDIVRTCFNGKTAERLFRRLVLPDLESGWPEMAGLPSTSPAYASMSFDQKLAIWRSMLAEITGNSWRGRK
ncbi:MAG: DNA-deoxyinosine glycosylase [Woeseiaceae bacterium]